MPPNYSCVLSTSDCQINYDVSCNIRRYMTNRIPSINQSNWLPDDILFSNVELAQRFDLISSYPRALYLDQTIYKQSNHNVLSFYNVIRRIVLVAI